ncbi:exosortase N [Flavobacteriales bacterium]|jgi:exosortase N|nr:exosortase N [Flavobacteriales bacterium]|tara:strand:+ start:5119 stop:6438 length:1320 start_codon:yes stop_codon:yes gene_type:complete
MLKFLKKYQPFLLIGLAILLALPVLSKFFQLNFEAIIGIMCFPFVLSFKKQAKYPIKWALISIAFIILYCFTGVMTANYFALGFLIFFLLENTFGGINWPSIALLFIVSPFFNYIIQVFSFPLRIQLTKWAVAVLKIIHPKLEAHGNVIQNGEISFSVDPECMGLNLIIFSLAVGLVLLVHFQKSTTVALNFWKTTLFILLLLFLTNLGNFFRIVTITLFQSKPGTLSHEVIGLFCLIVYTLIPIYFATKIYFAKKQKGDQTPLQQNPISKQTIFIYLPIIISVFILNFTGPKGNHSKVDDKYQSIQLKGYEKSVASTNIIKLENDSVLIYIKPPVGFFGADHSPKICWSGSGYKLKNQKETQLEQYLIQTSELIDKEDNILYTAWWFDNGSDKTGLQLEWRTKSLNGAAPFRLINVTTANPQQTLKTAKTLLSKNLFR